MRIESITLHRIKNTLRTPFKASYGVTNERESIIIEMKDELGYTGWGECVAFSDPWYTEETVETCRHMLEQFLIPIVLQLTMIEHPKVLTRAFSIVKKNNMAKASLEGAVWDLFAKRTGVTLKQAIGGTQPFIEAGVAIGLKDSDKLLKEISELVQKGYKRFKVKIMPEYDLELIHMIREHYPTIPLMADANSAYTLADMDRLKELDKYQLLMIEQPFAADDFIGHATLQRMITTPVCLDESIAAFSDVVLAHHLGSCQIINVKIGRVGGITEAIRIHDYCMEHGIGLWVGGMLEYGISRAQTMAIATLPGFTIPGDISETSRYWDEDITIETVDVKQGIITLPDEPGIGFQVNKEKLQRLTIDVKQFNRSESFPKSSS